MSGFNGKQVIQLIVLVAASCAAVDASAQSVLEIGMFSPTPGSISYNGGVAPLMGSRLQVDNIVGLGTPAHDEFISNCLSCVLDFSSGNFNTYDVAAKTWFFDGGGTIIIKGGVDFSDNSTVADIATGSTLLNGVFSSASVTRLPTGYYDFRIAAGAFDDTKNPAILSYYGMPDNVNYSGGLNLSFSAVPVNDMGFTSTAVYSGSIVNLPVVPLPGAVWLLGSGLLGLAGTVRQQS